jgi:CAAX protease family protein
MRSRVRVVRDTCETAGVMSTNLAAQPVAGPEADRFPYASWGVGAALFGFVLALVVGIFLGLPALLFGQKGDGDFTTFGNVVLQLGTALGFLVVPFGIAWSHGARSFGEAARQLGLRRFEPSAFKWMGVAVLAYLAIGALSGLLVEPKQEDIAEAFGPLPLQIALIAILAPISEEVCFRGMLFGGLRRRLPRLAAALIAGFIFGALHAGTGVSAIPVLSVFGVILCLLYEKTGSVVPGILLHILNNCVALLGQ